MVALGRCLCTLVLTCTVFAVKPHSISFGRWTTIKLVSENREETLPLKIRALVIDGKAKEFTFGMPHEITERLFVVQRIYRLNDSLPEEEPAPQWMWQKSGWVLVDRTTGRVQPVALADFIPERSLVNWFRDYAAYCAWSEDGKKAFAVVAQLGRKKPLLKKELALQGCPAPLWQRAPVRVTFNPQGEPKFTYTVMSRAVDPVPEDDEQE